MRIEKYTAVLGLVLLSTGIGCVRAAMAQPGAQPEVQVRAKTVAVQDRLTLGDLAHIKAGDSDVAARLRAISLGYAPNVGLVRELGRERIAMAIAAAGFAAGTVRLEAPAVVMIKRAAQEVDQTLVREAIERATLSEFNASGATARLVRLDLPSLIEAPAGNLEVRATTSSVRDFFAPFTVFVELWQEGHIIKRFNATAQVEAHAPIIVTAREMAANTRLRPDYYKLEVRKLERPLNHYITDSERLRGMAVRRAMGRGEPVTTDTINSEIVIRPGDQVRIIGQSGALQLMVNGEARAAGRIGDRIQVKNLQSGVLLQATVADEGLVRIRF